MERKQIFSIKKLKIGVASVLIGTGWVIAGGHSAATVHASENTLLTEKRNTEASTLSSETENKKIELEKKEETDDSKKDINPSELVDKITKSDEKNKEELVVTEKKEETKKVSSEESTVTESNKKKEKVARKRSIRALSDEETADYSGVRISGKLTNSKTEYAVGEQILGSYNLDVSSPSKIEEGGYILVTASSNEPLDTFEIGTSLRTEKVNDNQYRLYTGELSGGAYVNINVSYKLKKFETGKNSTTTIKAELFDKNNTLIKSTDFSNTNTTGTSYVSVDTRNGIRKQTLLETNQEETEIDVSKSKDLQLSLKSTNKEAEAITKIDHAVELPAGVTIAQTSLDAGWRLENGVAKYTRVVPSSTTVFASGDNTQNELLHLNVSNGGTPAEFLTGKKLTFKDSATYTDKSGFTNTTSDDVTVTVRAINPKKSIDGSDPGTVVGPVPTKSNVQVAIANVTMEENKSRVVNIAMPYVKTTTEDTRNIKLLGAYKGANGPASVKEVEISVDSNIDQNRAIEFYAIWTPTDEGKSTFVSYQNNPESLGLNSTLTFEVYSVANGTEKKIGEVSLRKGDAADKVALPDGITTIRLRPKGHMPLESSGLRQVGLFLSQDLKGLEEAKKLAKEGKKVESIVTSSVYTYGYDEPKVDVSKTTFANSREAIKLAPTTNPITATLAGNKTQELSSQYEVYEYSPNGLGNRIYNKQLFDRKTFVNLQDINAKNAKLLVELPDGFSYAGNDDSVKTIENYNNSGKTVLEVTPKNQNSEHPLSPNLQFKVDNWVESGKYPIKYTLVWNEDERVVGINPNNDYNGTNATITNTSSFTYELPVINNSATRLMTQVTDQTTDSSTYSTGAYNLAPNDKVKYRLSLTNSSNAATRNNVVISTLPRVSDKNIVLNSKDRGSQFDVHMTAAATTPEGWTAYYSTTPVSGTAVDLEKTITLTADQITDWSTVTAVKFVSNQDVALKAGSTAAFYIPAKASSTATNNQVAVLSSATRTDGQDTFNETNPARISIKIEDVKKGAVKVAYENKDNIPIKDTVTAIESRAYKKGYDVDTKEYKPDTLIGKDGKEYYFVKVKDSSPKPTGTIDSPEVTVTYVYDLLYDETEESHTVTRTIKYVDAEKKTQVADPVTQTATIKRVNKVNRKTKEVIEGTWSTANWDEKISPTVTNYGTPDKTSVSSVAVTPTTENTEVVVKYPQAKEDEVETKVITRTIKYVDASNENTEVSPKVVQTVTLTRTNKRNKVTNTLEEGTWTVGNPESWAEQVSPTVAKYGTPDKTSVSSVVVTPTTENTEVVVKYPQAKEDEVETKVITRTIKYVDASNENTEVSPKVVQTVTLTRTNKRNKVTNTLEEGPWTSGSWTEQASPTLAQYGTPDKTSVSSVAVTPTTENTEVVVKYPQSKEDEVETKVITRTIKYVDASNETTEVSPKVVQTVTLTRTNKRNKVTNTLEEGTWTSGSWTEQASPTLAQYGTPDKTSVSSVAVTPTTENTEVVVKYPQAKEDEVETKVITRTIKYVDASNEATEVSPKVVQTVTLTRTNKRNKVTNTLEEGTWTQGSWAEQASPTLAQYGTPDKTSVSSVAVTPTTENTEVVVKYPQAKEDEVETKVITRTIKYVDASNEATEVSPKVVQTVTLTRTNKRNKVTNTLEEGTWTQGSWAEQASPTLAQYGTPDKTSVSSVAVTPTTENTEVVVKYPQSKEDEVETKVITRTIKYVDASNETTEVSPKVVQTVTLTRTNKRNKVTNTLEEGPWTSGSWTEQASPTLAQYGTPDKTSVSSVAVTPTTENTEVVVKYPQSKEDEVETKVITRTIKYVDASNETTEVSPKVVQTVTLTRTNKRNKVTNTLEEGTWTSGSWTEQASPTLAKYGTPDKTSVSSVAVTPTTENTEVVVKYPQAKEDEVETKVITRTIKYVDASNEATEVSPKVVQTVTLTRTNKRNKVTNTLEEGTWTQGSWAEQASPTLAQYGTPDKTSVSSVAVTPTTENTEVVVKYPQSKEDEVETKVITRTIKYVDASNETTEVSPKVVQTVTLTRTNKRNKVTNTLEEGTWTQGSWAEQASPTLAQYGTPDKTSVSSVAVTPTTENTEVVVKYPQSKEDEVETKVITRTIKYVDASNETTEVSPKVVQTVTLTRTNKRNKVTNTLEEGTWTQGSWAEQASPTLAQYGTPDKTSVSSVAVTPTTENTEVVVKYPQSKEDEVETKVITRTIKYVDASNETTEVSPKVVQTVTLTRTNKRNKVTNTLEEGPWTSGSWTEQASPTLAQYGTPDKTSVSSVAVTPTTENTEVVVKYPQATIPVTPTTPQNPNEDPKNPNPGDPIDPKNPTGPKWTKDALDKLNNVKSVTRTITYIKDGTTEEVSPTEAPKWTDKVSFTRTVVVNPKDGSVVGYDTTGDGIADVAATDTTSGWKAAGTAKFTEKTSPVVKGYVVKPNQDTQGDLVEADGSKVKASTTDLTVDSPNQDLKVRYVLVGTWTPKVPEGATPIDPIPYTNDPTDPGKVVDPNKPTDPNEPNKPNVPVIPHIPGTTPKNSDGNPLKPVDLQDPSKGYVPPTPKTPTENTEIKYEKDTQKATVNYVVEGTNTVLHTDELEGKSGEPINYTTETKLAELKALGYELVNDGFTTATDKNFDKDTKVDQNFVVTVKSKVVDVPPFDPTNPNDPKTPKPGQPIDPENPTGPKWTEELIKSLENTKHVNRTISYVKEDGSKVEYTDKDGNKSTADVTDKVTFTREAKINVVTGTIEYDKWTPVNNDTTFDKVTSPVVSGYVLKDPAQKEVAETTGLTENSKDETIKVVYVPVGKVTITVPPGVTPPTPVTDTPYENVPGEPGKVVPPSPTKPTDPQDPNSPKVPVIPHIPGTTPQVPKDPTKPVDPNTNPLVPLEPVTPGKPEDGYKVPPVPTDPTTNTSVNYVKDGQKAITKFVDLSGKPIPGVTNIEETGESGEPLTKATEVTTEITKLIAKGYDLVSNNYGKDNNGNFDKDSGKDQEYTVVLTTHIQDVPPFDPTNPNDPNTPKPGQPIDPENPTGPKWTEELIKSLETTKHVNRTISYVKEDGNKVEYTDKAGNKSTADVTDKVTFTRPAKINVVTGTIEYGKWTPVNNDTTFDKVTSPVAPGYVLKDASQKEVPETTGLTENSKDETIKVVYVPVGKVTITVPPGVTPPTPVTDTPYENVPGEPGKVVPPSPTKPTDPQDPNSPKVPVIPHIPGTTPQVPKDPTKPVDPKTNPLVPLEPVTPGKPEDGYKVPPVPTDPTTNTSVNYVKDGQKAITNFVDNNGKPVSDPVVDQGDSGTKFTKSGEVESKIKALVKKGYVVTSNDYPSADTDRVFDNDKDKDQVFTVKVTPLIVPTDPNSPDKPMVPTDPTKPVGPNNPLRPVTPSTPEPGKPVFPEDPNSPVWPETVKDMVTESSATRTITYVDRIGKEVAATHTETIKFKRTAKVNLVTGNITYGDWTVVDNDTILDGNKLPKVDGYIARGGNIESSQKDIKATAGENITETVVYDKLGSWIPKLPEGQTKVPPIPYPNNPTDPTKPGTDKPRVPYVPGFIPVDPNGNPLKPVDPNDPTKGYEVPDVPADPTQDSPITYVPTDPRPYPGPNPTPAPQPAPAPQPEPKPEPKPETPRPATPAENGGNNGTPTNNGDNNGTSTNNGDQTQLRELPNTGTGQELSIFGAAASAILAGLGLVVPGKKKEEEEE